MKANGGKVRKSELDFMLEDGTVPNKVTLYGFAPSTFVRTARLVCEEKGADYELKPLEFKQESHSALHPFLRMPVLKIGKVRLYETLAIAMFLDGKLEGDSLQPTSLHDCATMYQWISAASHYIYHDLVSGALKDEKMLASRPDDFSAHLQTIENALADSEFLVGEKLTLADLFLAPQLIFIRSREGGESLIGQYKHTLAWTSRLSARPSFARTET